MILVRDIFQIKFGRMREATQSWEEGKKFIMASNPMPPRILTDLTGQYYTLVMEMQFNSLADWEAMMKSELPNPDWRAWYQKFMGLVDSGRREIFNVVQ